MRVLVLASAIAAVVGLGFASTPAMADCAADIASVKKHVSQMKKGKQKSTAMRHLARAQKSLKAKKMKSCAANVAAAKKSASL
jgi:hypothetical protein